MNSVNQIKENKYPRAGVGLRGREVVPGSFLVFGRHIHQMFSSVPEQTLIYLLPNKYTVSLFESLID